MPISSTEISNLIQSQQAMFANSAVYAAAIGGQSAGGISAVPVQDPRSPGPGAAVNVAANLPNYAAGGTAMMAAFGLAPRALDPFTATMAAGAAGLRHGGAAGAIGLGGITAGAYMAGGAAMNAVGFEPFAQGAQTRGMLNQFVGGMMPGAGSGQVGQVSSAIEGMNQQGYGTLNELTGLMSQGVAAGTLSTTSVSEFQASFQKLVTNARQIAQTLNTSITEGNAALQSIKSLGLGTSQATDVIAAIGMAGRATGMSPAQLTTAAAGGIQTAQALGGDVAQAAQGAVVNRALTSVGQRMGGAFAEIAEVSERQQGKFQAGAMRFLGSGYGTKMLAAAFDPATGGLDVDVAQRMATGGISRQEIGQLAQQTLGRNRDAFTSRRSELASQFLGEFGPQGISPALREMTSGSPMQQTLMQTVSGLPRRDLQALEQLSNQTPMLRSQFMQAAREGWSEGQAEVTTLGGALSQAAGALTKPLRDKFRAMGRDLAQTVFETQEEVTRQFVGSPPPRLDPALAGVRFRAEATGDARTLRTLDQAAAALPAAQQGGLGRTSTEFQRQMIPPALRLQTMGAGTTPFELPMWGLGTEEHSMPLTMGAAGLGANLAVRRMTGMNPLELPGRAVGALGRSLRGATGTGGLAPFTGRGLFRGSAAFAGAAGQGMGFLARQAGRFAGNPWVAGAAIAGIAAVNILPELGRRTGLVGATPDVTGHNAGLVRLLEQQGLVGKVPAFEEGRGMESIDLGKDRMGGVTAGMAEEVRRLAGLPVEDDTLAMMGGGEQASAALRLMQREQLKPGQMMQRLQRQWGVSPEQSLALIRAAGAIEGVVGGRSGMTASQLKAHRKRLESRLDVDNVVESELAPLGEPGDSKAVASRQHQHKQALAMIGRGVGKSKGFAAELAKLDFELPLTERGEHRTARSARVFELLEGVEGSAAARGFAAEAFGSGTLGLTRQELSDRGVDPETTMTAAGAAVGGEGGSGTLRDTVMVGAQEIAAAVRGVDESTRQQLIRERRGAMDAVGLAAGAAGGTTAGLEEYISELRPGQLRGPQSRAAMRERLAKAGITSEQQLTKFARTAGRGGTAGGGFAAEVAQDTARTKRALRAGGRGRNVERFVENLVGDFGGNLGPEAGAFFRDEAGSSADTRRFMRNAARQLIGQNPDEGQLRDTTQRLIDASTAFAQGDRSKALEIADSLSSGMAPPHPAGGKRTGALLQRLPEFEKAIADVTRAVIDARNQITGQTY